MDPEVAAASCPAPPAYDSVPLLKSSDDVEMEAFDGAPTNEQKSPVKEDAKPRSSSPPLAYPVSTFASHPSSAVTELLSTEPTSGQTPKVVTQHVQQVQVHTHGSHWDEFAVPPRSNYCGLACFTCLCCCWPLGLIALFFSLKSQNESAQGDYHKARASAMIAQRLSMAGIIIGFILIIAYIILKAA